MTSNLVRNWFGAEFTKLHPLLQQLHVHGGYLKGTVEVDLPVGVAGLIGRALAKKIGVPIDKSVHDFSVAISHQVDGLHWDRCFSGHGDLRSVFQPIGRQLDGYWIESTGPITMHLTVDVQDGGWYWRCLRFYFYRFRLPLWLVPSTKAYKAIENDRYRFSVAFFMPLLGKVLSYEGLLDAEPADSHKHETNRA